jgi:ElaB/YqjD/DUF883 family membrane-anchored ribosome-binding protein
MREEVTMNALQTLFAQLRELLPDQAEELIATYRTNAAADSRASRQRERERIQRLRKQREQAKKAN